MNIRTFKVFTADEIDKGVYEIVTADRVFSYIVSSAVEPKRDDIITVRYQLFGCFVVCFVLKIVRDGDVVYVYS